jgi:type I restriction enzyme S subunit
VSGEYLLAWLTCKYGSVLKNRLKRNLMVSFIGKDDLYNIPVPVLPKKFQLQIEQIVKSANQKQSHSKQLYKEAEELLLKELGLLDYQQSHTLTFSATKKEVDVAKRIDSEYFHPIYNEIIEKIEKYELGCGNIGSQFQMINGRTPPNYYEEESDIQVLKTKEIRSEGVNYEKVAYANASEVENLLLDRDIIFASMGVGSLGRTGIFYRFETQKRTSIDSTLKILRKKGDIEPEVLLVYLNSPIGQEYIYKYVVGSTGIISIKNDLIESLKIPLLDNSTQHQIANKVQDSHRLRKESKELLEKAKLMVELEIERQ